MAEVEYEVGWDMNSSLEGLSRDNFGLRQHFHLDGAVINQKVCQYVHEINDALEDYAPELSGEATVYQMENMSEEETGTMLREEAADWTPDDVFGEGIPAKSDRYFANLAESNELRDAIRAYRRGADMETVSVDAPEDIDDWREGYVILGADVTYDTPDGEVTFSFDSTDMHYNWLHIAYEDEEAERFRDRFRTFRDNQPFTVTVSGDAALKEAIAQESNDIGNYLPGRIQDRILFL